MKTILVIDDDDLIREMMAGVLKNAKYVVMSAENGNVGIDHIKKISVPDLVITDILMPDKEGLETISEIKEINPNIKIIAMSGGGQAKDMTFLDLAKHMGAHHTLKKPFRPGLLLETVEKVLES